MQGPFPAMATARGSCGSMIEPICHPYLAPKMTATRHSVVIHNFGVRAVSRDDQDDESHLNWVLPHIWCRVVVNPAAEPILSPICLSCPGQHLAFQEIVTRTPVHLALDHLEAIDLPLDRAGAPGLCDRGFHRFNIAFDPRSK